MSNIPISTLLDSYIQITAQKGKLDETYVAWLSTCIQKAQPELEEAGITDVVSCVSFAASKRQLCIESLSQSDSRQEQLSKVPGLCFFCGVTHFSNPV